MKPYSNKKNKMLLPKKSLGQNFLKNAHIAENMARAGETSSEDTVVEIGPGKGMLTHALIAAGAHVIAVEKDCLLIPFLKERFEKEIQTGKLVLVHGDALAFDPKDHQLQTTNYKLISNIPYYITGEIFRHFLSLKKPPTLMVLMVQKEVAERIVARDGKESILSLSVKYFGEPKIMQTVKAGNFSPAPKVDSAILVVENIARSTSPDEEKKFFALVKAGFARKRKLLLSNLAAIGINKALLEKAFHSCGVSDKARAEEVKLSQWKRLAEFIEGFPQTSDDNGV